MWRICAMKKCSRCTTRSTTSLSVAAGGALSAACGVTEGAAFAAGGALGAADGLTADGGADGPASCAATARLPANTTTIKPNPEPTIRIRTFWERLRQLENDVH